MRTSKDPEVSQLFTQLQEKTELASDLERELLEALAYGDSKANEGFRLQNAIQEKERQF